MNKLITLSVLLVIGLKSFSQGEPVQNYEQILKKGELSVLKTMFYRSEDTTLSEGRLLFSKEFDLDGKIIKKYLFTFWDVVSYDHTTTYVYDSIGNLIEKTKIQRILNLNKNDEKFIRVMGDDPINEKSFYTYHNNKLKKETHYTFGKGQFDKTEQPSNTVQYEYDKKGVLKKEVGKTPNGMVIYQNYIAEYEYDIKGNKIREHRVFTTSPSKDSTTLTFVYDEDGNLVEEKTEDTANPRNNKHLRHEYDKEGKMVKTLRYSDKNGDWIVDSVNEYDSRGHPKLGDDQTTFDYYENGLIRQELWKSSDGAEVVNFITSYIFHE